MRQSNTESFWWMIGFGDLSNKMKCLTLFLLVIMKKFTQGALKSSPTYYIYSVSEAITGITPIFLMCTNIWEYPYILIYTVSSLHFIFIKILLTFELSLLYCMEFSVVFKEIILLNRINSLFTLFEFCRYFLSDTTGKKVKEQTGVVRTNCIDCLDRTNVTQVRWYYVCVKLFWIYVYHFR